MSERLEWKEIPQAFPYGERVRREFFHWKGRGNGLLEGSWDHYGYIWIHRD